MCLFNLLHQFQLHFKIKLWVKNPQKDELLSVKSKTGETAFSRASTKSVKISKFILDRDVNVSTIDSKFLTPQFYFEELVMDMLLEGRINPKGGDFYYENFLMADFSFSQSSNFQKSIFIWIRVRNHEKIRARFRARKKSCTIHDSCTKKFYRARFFSCTIFWVEMQFSRTFLSQFAEFSLKSGQNDHFRCYLWISAIDIFLSWLWLCGTQNYNGF